MNDSIKCPKCGSTQIHASNRGWSIWTGAIGSRRVIITCLVCGHQFKPGQGASEPPAPSAPVQYAGNRVNDAAGNRIIISCVVALPLLAFIIFGLGNGGAHLPAAPTAQAEQGAGRLPPPATLKPTPAELAAESEQPALDARAEAEAMSAALAGKPVPDAAAGREVQAWVREQSPATLQELRHFGNPLDAPADDGERDPGGPAAQQDRGGLSYDPKLFSRRNPD